MATHPSRTALTVLSFIALVAIVPWLHAAEVSSRRLSASEETFVYVHGGWTGGYYLRTIERLLRARGHEVYRPTLTGLGERVHLANENIDLDTHIKDIVNLILWEDLRDVVLVGRSYGGMVISGVVDQLPDRIKRVIYISAFVPKDGESVRDINAGPVRNPENGFVPPRPPVLPDTAPPHFVAQPAKTLSQKIKLQHQEAVARIPTTYILIVEPGKQPKEDPFFKFAELGRARGWKIVTLEADHVPEMSRPYGLLPLLTDP